MRTSMASSEDNRDSGAELEVPGVELQIVETEPEATTKNDDLITAYTILNQRCDELLSRIAARKNNKPS